MVPGGGRGDSQLVSCRPVKSAPPSVPPTARVDEAAVDVGRGDGGFGAALRHLAAGAAGGGAPQGGAATTAATSSGGGGRGRAGCWGRAAPRRQTAHTASDGRRPRHRIRPWLSSIFSAPIRPTKTLKSWWGATRVTDQREGREAHHHRAWCLTNLANQATSFRPVLSLVSCDATFM